MDQPRASPQPFLQPGRIGPLTLRNRLVRASTSETMATEDGAATPALVRLYRDLALGGAGLILTGHIFVLPEGQYEPRQLGLHEDRFIAPLREVTRAVHEAGGTIFAELSHAGSQSLIPAVTPVAPSVIPNAIFARAPVELDEAGILRIVEGFGQAAARARAAGFDGIHLHGGNGYLLSQFNSPLTNRRQDGWGGSAAGRSRFLTETFRAVRRAVGADFPVTLRLGLADAVPGGISLDEGIERARLMAREGVDAIEVTYGVMSAYQQNIRPWTGTTPRQALADGAIHRIFAAPVPEAYYRSFARQLKAAVEVPVILVGGLRSAAVMADVIASGDADFLALARPFVREPDLAQRLAGGSPRAACVSCNLCFRHEGIDALRCWRTPAGILEHVLRHYLLRPARAALTRRR